MKALSLVLALCVVLAACRSEPSKNTGSQSSSPPADVLGGVLYSKTFPFTQDYGGGAATVTVTVKEKGFTFAVAVTSTSLYVCYIGESVIADGRKVNLDPYGSTPNFVPHNYNGCDNLYPTVDATGDVYMLTRMNMDPTGSFQFEFDEYESQGLFDLP